MKKNVFKIFKKEVYIFDMSGRKNNNDIRTADPQQVEVQETNEGGGTSVNAEAEANISVVTTQPTTHAAPVSHNTVVCK